MVIAGLVAISFLLFILVLLVYQKETRLKRERLEEQERELTKEEILKMLSAPATSSKILDQEKREILENLSASQEKSNLTNKEKEEILKSLSAP